jgi:negative regulator of replication initiation
MKTLHITVDDGLFEEIEKRTTVDFDHGDVVQKLLKKALMLPQQKTASESMQNSKPASLRKDNIVSFVQSPDYKVLSGINRYLAVLGWLHKNRPEEFKKIENYRKGNRVYFGKSQQQVEESGDGITAKQIPDSNLWALSTLDNRAKRGLIEDILQLCNFQPSEVNAVVNSIPDSGRHRRENIFANFQG